MNDIVKSAFAAAMVNKKTPESCPAHVVELYTVLCRYRQSLASNQEPQHTDRWWIAALADSLHVRDEKIAALEKRLADLEGQRTLSYVADEEDDPTVPKIDKRTKEWRERKAALAET